MPDAHEVRITETGQLNQRDLQSLLGHQIVAVDFPSNPKQSNVFVTTDDRVVEQPLAEVDLTYHPWFHP